MQHTLVAYELELNRLENLITGMGRYAVTQLESALLALQDRRSEIAAGVIAGDARSDAWEAEVDELVVELIALRQPTAGDLRHVTTAFKAAVHLERIGDYAANLAKRSLRLPAEVQAKDLLGLPEMGKWTLDMLRDTIRAYEKRDAELAISTWNRDQMLDTLTSEFFIDTANTMKGDSKAVDAGTHLLFIAKNLERVGDHATNICELVYFRVMGTRLPGAHPRHSTIEAR